MVSKIKRKTIGFFDRVGSRLRNMFIVKRDRKSLLDKAVEEYYDYLSAVVDSCGTNTKVLVVLDVSLDTIIHVNSEHDEDGYNNPFHRVTDLYSRVYDYDEILEALDDYDMENPDEAKG